MIFMEITSFKISAIIIEKDGQMEILCYGSLNIDYIYHVPHQIKPGETLSSRSLEKNPGGKGENQAAALAKAGCAVKMAGKIGKDGAFLLDALKATGVDTSEVRVSDGFTGHAIIQLSDDGENSIILFSGANREQKEEEIRDAFSRIEEGSYLIIQNDINELSYIIRCAKDKKMKIVFNPSPFDSSILSLPLNDIDILIVNEGEAAELAGLPENTDYERILDKLRSDYNGSEVIMTVGKNGAFYQNKEERYYQPIINGPVVDTTAAGDTFAGYFIASRIRGYNPEKAMYYATKASGIAVSREGAMKSIPLAEEVFS